jgi:alpha-glucosidase
MTESYSPLNFTLLFYGNGSHDGSHVPFNFELIMGTNEQSTAKVFKDLVELWLTMMPKGKQANWVVSKIQ